MNKGVIFQISGNKKEAIKNYDEVIKQFSTSKENIILEIVNKAKELKRDFEE